MLSADFGVFEHVVQANSQLNRKARENDPKWKARQHDPQRKSLEQDLKKKARGVRTDKYFVCRQGKYYSAKMVEAEEAAEAEDPNLL